MRALRPMTQEEREFAEQKHDLVVEFLRRRHLPMNDYYDIVIFGIFPLCSSISVTLLSGWSSGQWRSGL